MIVGDLVSLTPKFYDRAGIDKEMPLPIGIIVAEEEEFLGDSHYYYVYWPARKRQRDNLSKLYTYGCDELKLVTI